MNEKFGCDQENRLLVRVCWSAFGQEQSFNYARVREMKLTELLRRRMSRDPAIQVSETHFCVGEKAVAWSAVHSIKGYKLDLGTVDEIRILVAYDGGHTLELSEEQDGYETFIAKAEQRFWFPNGWWTVLAHPAFERNEVTLFRRDAE